MRTRYEETIKFFKEAFESKANFAWVNTGVIMSDDSMDRIKNDLVDLGSKAMVIVSSIEKTRPQRTWGDLPEWFRPLNEYNTFGIDPEPEVNNTFIFALTSKIYDEEKFEQLLLSLPECHYTTVFPIEEFEDII